MGMALPGWASKQPEYLCPCIRGRYLELLRWGRDVGVSLTTIETARSPERQAYYKKIGASRTLKSKHLSVGKSGSLAFDIAPTDYLVLKNWNPRGPLWKRMGKMGKIFGLEWGGDWKSFPDLPHFQLSKCECEE